MRYGGGVSSGRLVAGSRAIAGGNRAKSRAGPGLGSLLYFPAHSAHLPAEMYGPRPLVVRRSA